MLDLEKPLTEEEKKAREARRRERERRYRDNKEKKPNRRLDIIDQLDHTSLFGAGCSYSPGNQVWGRCFILPLLTQL